MKDFIRIATAVPHISVGDTGFNASQIVAMADEAIKQGSDIVLFPELSITGYTCGDLFFQDALLNSVKEQIARIVETTNFHAKIIVFGAPLIIKGQLYNTAIVAQGGKVCGIIPNTFLPEYGEFCEKRWFSSAEDITDKYIFASELGFVDGYELIPIGNNLIFKYEDGTTFAVEVCEDFWSPIPQSSFLALNGAEIILNLSASPQVVTKQAHRKDLVITQSAKCKCVYAYVSSGTDESTTDAVFAGACMIAENGKIIKENKRIPCDTDLVIADVDLGKIRMARKFNKTFKDCASLYGRIISTEIVPVIGAEITSDGSMAYVSKNPFVPENKQERFNRCSEIFALQVAGLKKRMKITGAKAVVGVSGGLDSTLALLVAVQATKDLGMTPDNVHAITMPCFGTSDRTYNNSLKLMEKLGVTAREISIKEACLLHFKDIGHDPEKHDLTFENTQARERTQVLMDYAGKVGGFVVGTGDLSELALGWCTYNADHMSMYGVNSGVPKTLIKWVITSAMMSNDFADCLDVLNDILDTPISPELLPPDKDGKISQQTEDLVGPYALHDFFLFYMLRYGYEPEKIYELAKLAFKGEYDNATILKWLKNFYRRFFTQQFKRNCIPDGVKVGSVGLSPRSDYKMPSDASAKLWLDRVEKLK